MKTQLSELVSVLEEKEVRAPQDLTIGGLALDSRETGEGTLFFALPGEKEDGGDYIAEAKARGAACAVCEQPPETEIPYILVPDAHKEIGRAHV